MDRVVVVLRYAPVVAITRRCRWSRLEIVLLSDLEVDTAERPQSITRRPSYNVHACTTIVPVANPTSFRLPAELLTRTAEEAAREGVSVTSLVSSLLDEGLKTRRFPGIVFRDGPTGRRAAVSGGPDVWEIVRAIRLTDGEGEGRVRQVALDTGIAIGLLHLAVDYASAYPDEIDARIALDEIASERVRQMVEERERLLSR